MAGPAHALLVQIREDDVVAPAIPSGDANNWPWNYTRIVTVDGWYDPDRYSSSEVVSRARSMPSGVQDTSLWPSNFFSTFRLQQVRCAGGL